MSYGTSSPGTSTATELGDITEFRPILNPEIVACPQPVYHRLHDECPVMHTDVGVAAVTSTIAGVSSYDGQLCGADVPDRAPDPPDAREPNRRSRWTVQFPTVAPI